MHRVLLLVASIFLLGLPSARGGAEQAGARAGDVGLRRLAPDELIDALRSGVLVSPQSVEIRVLGAVRATTRGKDSYVEIANRECKVWKRVALDDIVSVTETLAPPVTCSGATYPFLRVTLRKGSRELDADEDGPDVVLLSKSSAPVQVPVSVLGGALGISDVVWNACVDRYLDCQLRECAGKGRWCQSMCDAEFDWCTRGR